MLIEITFFVWFSYEFLRILILTFLPAKMFVISPGFLNCTNDFLWGSHFHCLTTSDFIFSANLKCKSGPGSKYNVWWPLLLGWVTRWTHYFQLNLTPYSRRIMPITCHDPALCYAPFIRVWLWNAKVQ